MSDGTCYHACRQAFGKGGYSHSVARLARRRTPEAELLKRHTELFAVAEANHFRSIAFPAISTRRVCGYPRAQSRWRSLLRTASDGHPLRLPEQVYFVCYDEETARLYARLLYSARRRPA